MKKTTLTLISALAFTATVTFAAPVFFYTSHDFNQNCPSPSALTFKPANQVFPTSGWYITGKNPQGIEFTNVNYQDNIAQRPANVDTNNLIQGAVPMVLNLPDTGNVYGEITDTNQTICYYTYPGIYNTPVLTMR